jgi:pyruvate/2-oxoglutarate dehydrogenase complex dihydrolipoamide dehydrogenase (E3) component
MIATGGALSFARRLDGMGLAQVETEINVQQLRNRIQSIEDRLERSVTELLTSLEVQIIRGTAHLSGPNSVSVKTEVDEIEIEDEVEDEVEDEIDEVAVNNELEHVNVINIIVNNPVLI